MNKIIPAKVIPYNYCNKCKTNNSIYLFDVYDRDVNYKKIILTGEVQSKYPIDYMICGKCMTQYNIKWDNGIPTPIRNNNIMNNVIKNFNK